MDMQDKELDKLFSAQLDDLGVQPSAQVWENIAAGLDKRNSKKRLIPFLSVAASITVLVTASILLIPQKQNISKHPNKNIVAVTKGKVNIKSTQTNILKTDTLTSATTGASPVYAIINKPNSSHSAKTTKIVHLNKDFTIDTPGTTEQPVLAAVTQRQADVINAVVPDENIALRANETPALDVKHIVAIANLSASEKPVRKRHRINTFGDMVNAVVAKIDKRQDKFIKFSNTDGDEATITSVNLGLVKIKTEDKVD